MTTALPLPTVPFQDGFRMPGEFEPHAGCWMLWPERPDVWRDGAGPAQRAFAAVAAAIARFEPVTVGVSAESLPTARAHLPQTVAVVPLAYSDAWMRDNGPTFVVDDAGALRAVDWAFNAWGGLYADWQADDRLAAQVAACLGIGRYRCPLVLEGGAFDVDGQGTVIITASVACDPRRNPGIGRTTIERALALYLGAERVIWLPGGVNGDETGGHVDNLVRFVRPGELALTWTDDRADPQYEISVGIYEMLRHATDARGRRLKIHRLHQPGPLHMTAAESAGLIVRAGTYPRPAGQRLAASYVNFYIANGGVIAPQFDDPHDAAALAALRALFPEREVVGVPTREILLGGGNIHCITQQQPQV